MIILLGLGCGINAANIGKNGENIENITNNSQRLKNSSVEDKPLTV